MPNAYWIAQITVSDPEAYRAYQSANATAFQKYGARFVVRGGTQEVVEGTARPRMIVVEFPDLATARACWHSPEYQAAHALRAAPVSASDVVIVEGWEGAQPGD
jgi:uncharacterized protein (DUF1330 family)